MTVFVVAIKVIKFYKSGELDIDTWTRIIFDTATERDKERYKKYKEIQAREEKEQDELKGKIELAKKENRSIEQIMLIFDELTTKYPYFHYFTDKAKLYAENKLYNKALIEYKKAINSVKERGFRMYKSYGYHLVSEMYSDIKDYANAIKYASKAIKVHNGGYMHIDFADGEFSFSPGMYSKDMAYKDRAELYFEIGKYKLALKDIKEVLKECTLDSWVIFYIKTLIKLKRFNEAEKMCEKYFVKDEYNLANYSACMGYIAQAQNNFKQAFDFYNKALNYRCELCFYETEIIHKSKNECQEAIKNSV